MTRNEATIIPRYSEKRCKLGLLVPSANRPTFIWSPLKNVSIRINLIVTEYTDSGGNQAILHEITL